uniref:Uncharacterized protein n=1 Tax=Arundo donax TaxID=35708 RepID=A0A0A8Y612_ARUDO
MNSDHRVSKRVHDFDKLCSKSNKCVITMKANIVMLCIFNRSTVLLYAWWSNHRKINFSLKSSMVILYCSCRNYAPMMPYKSASNAGEPNSVSLYACSLALQLIQLNAQIATRW